MDDYKAARDRMVDRQIARRGITDRAVLAAMRWVPRDRFVDPLLIDEAYADRALPIAEGQTISQPYVVALMVEAARIAPRSRVLEIGAGSGYAAAVLGRIAGEVFAIERHPALACAAAERLAALGAAHAHIIAGDGIGGWPEHAPYDAILISAAAAAVPQALLTQLGPGGRLVMPLGPPGGVQTLTRFTRNAAGGFDITDFGGVSFIPLIGG